LSATRAAAGFLAALLLPLLVTPRLRRLAARVLLDRALARNARAGAARINDLDEWVRTQLEAGKPVEDVLDSVTDALALAKPASDARERLGKAVNDADLGKNDFVAPAKKRAEKPLATSDVLGAGGKKRERLDFDVWTAGLRQLVADHALLEGLEAHVGALPPDRQDEARRAIRDAGRILATIDSPEKVAGL
jgi:hypothetical protein